MYEKISALLLQRGYTEKTFNHFYKGELGIVVKKELLIASDEKGKELLINYSVSNYEAILRKLEEKFI